MSNMRTIKQYATPLWLIPPLLFFVPPTKRLVDRSIAQACMRTATLAGRLLITAPILCPEDLRCWEELQRVIFMSQITDNKCVLWNHWQELTILKKDKLKKLNIVNTDVGWEVDYIFISFDIPNKAWFASNILSKS